nr:hypothetical protein [Leuven Tombus-like virus 2]
MFNFMYRGRNAAPGQQQNNGAEQAEQNQENMDQQQQDNPEPQQQNADQPDANNGEQNQEQQQQNPNENHQNNTHREEFNEERNERARITVETLRNEAEIERLIGERNSRRQTQIRGLKDYLFLKSTGLKITQDYERILFRHAGDFFRDNNISNPTEQRIIWEEAKKEHKDDRFENGRPLIRSALDVSKANKLNEEICGRISYFTWLNPFRVYYHKLNDGSGNEVAASVEQTPYNIWKCLMVGSVVVGSVMLGKYCISQAYSNLKHGITSLSAPKQLQQLIPTDTSLSCSTVTIPRWLEICYIFSHHTLLTVGNGVVKGMSILCGHLQNAESIKMRWMN